MDTNSSQVEHQNNGAVGLSPKPSTLERLNLAGQVATPPTLGAELVEAEKPPTKSGGWFAKPPVRKDYIPPAPTSYPMKVTKDFHQIWQIDTDISEGVVYTIDITHPDTNEAKTYVVHPDVVYEAMLRCGKGDYIFAVPTDKSCGLTGEVRAVELHPWVTRTGQFGLLP